METKGNHSKQIYLIGAVATIVVLIGIVADIAIGTATGGDISALPQTAIGRFEQFNISCWLGLYNLDLLNIVNQLILIPAILALYIAHRQVNYEGALLAFILFLVGTVIFVTGNVSLTMLDLSKKYFAATSETQKNLIASAGEAMLAKGAHGSFSVFFGFFVPTLANTLMSVVMLKGRVFSKLNSYLGIIGNILMLAYILLVTFVPQVEKQALLVAMPGGLMLMAWMIMYTARLLKLRSSVSS